MIKKHQNRNNLFILCGVVLSSIISVCGCSKKDQPASVPVAAAIPAQAQPSNAIQKSVSSVKLPVVKSNSSQFDFSGKKDPFKPFVSVKPVAVSGSKPVLDSLPIHSFDVSQFRMIGIVTGAKENQAMVVDPNGKGYVLKLGMTIGKNDGRITAITSNGVDVLEQFKDDNGRVRKENIRITLPRKQ